MKRIVLTILTIVLLLMPSCRWHKHLVLKETEVKLPLYEFKNKDIHNKLLSLIEEYLVDNDGSRFEALFIEYYSELDTIGTYGEDSIPYGYNLLIETVNGSFHGDVYEEIMPRVTGCCMIGDYYCYIGNNDLTTDRLFTKTEEVRKDTLYKYNHMCWCCEEELEILLDEHDSILYVPYWEIKHCGSSDSRGFDYHVNQ